MKRFCPLVVALPSGISKPRFCQTYVLQFGAFHENDENHENDKNDKDKSDSHKQGVDCWIYGNHGKHGNDENHENPGCKT